MQDQLDLFDTPLTRRAWNKGKIVGAKPPLRPKHVWSIKTKLQIEGRKRDLALFNLAIDSKLRGCDLVSGHPVKFELSEHTRHAIDDYLQACAKQSVDYLFTGRRGTGMCLTTRQFARLVSGWLSSNGVDALQFGTHFCVGRSDANIQANR
jgi:hypothetical protein